MALLESHVLAAAVGRDLDVDRLSLHGQRVLARGEIEQVRPGAVGAPDLFVLELDRLVGRGLAARQGHPAAKLRAPRSEEHTSELQSLTNLVCRLLLEKKNIISTPDEGQL